MHYVMFMIVETLRHDCTLGARLEKLLALRGATAPLARYSSAHVGRGPSCGVRGLRANKKQGRVLVSY